MYKYEQYPNSNLIREWDKLLKLQRNDVVELYDSWKEIKERNDKIRHQIFEEKSQKLKAASEYMRSIGIDVYKYKGSGLFPKKSGYKAWFKTNVADVISGKYPNFEPTFPNAHMSEQEVDGVRLWNNQSPTTIIELYDRISQQYKSKINQVKKEDKLLIKSIEYATKNDVDIEDLPPKSIISVVEEHAKEQYLIENLPNGTEVYLKHGCYECSTYIMGEHRCSCGNRRISIVVEGDIIEGFHHYPDPY